MEQKKKTFAELVRPLLGEDPAFDEWAKAHLAGESDKKGAESAVQKAIEFKRALHEKGVNKKGPEYQKARARVDLAFAISQLPG